jgi:hypothetical protein
MIPHIVIEVTRLPERQSARSPLALLPRLDRNLGFQKLHGFGHHVFGRLAQQQMDVFRHNNIPEDMNLKAPAYLFEREQERTFHMRLDKKRQPMIATEGEKVCLARMMKPFESFGHDGLSHATHVSSHSTSVLGALPPLRQK